MSAAAWDVLAKAANVAQMIAMLVAVFTRLQRVQQSNRRECAELERCIHKLHELLQWPTTGALLSSDMGGPVLKALVDAASLVDSYKKSTLWCHIRSGGWIRTQLRDMQDVINSHCCLVIFMNAHLLLSQAAHQHPPSSDARIHEVNDTSQSPSGHAVTTCPAGEVKLVTIKGPTREETETDPAAGSERNLPALLPVVISHT